MTTQNQSNPPPLNPPGQSPDPAGLIQALQEGSRQVLAHDDFRETARAIYTILKKYLGSAAGYVALLSQDEQTNELLFLDAGGLPCRVDPTLPMPVRGMRAEAYRTGKVIYDNNFPESPWADFLPKDHARLDNVLFAPLKIQEKVVGVIGLANKPGGFTDQDAQTAGIFGELAAIALDKSQTAEQLKISEDTQLFLLQCGYLSPGENFFESLARYLAQSLEMDYVCIDRLEGDGLSARTVAIYFDGKFEDNVEYRLQDTPCGEVVGKTICCFPKEVRHLFPRDTVLQEMLAESYVGTTLLNFEGKPIGLIAMIGRKPLVNPHLAESILKLVAVRAAGELERQQALEALIQAQIALEERVRDRTAELTRANEKLNNEIQTGIHMQNALVESERKFRAIFNQTFQVVGLLKPDGTVLEINQTALDYFLISYPDSIGRPLWDLRGDQDSEANRALLKEAVAQAAGGRLVRFEVQIPFDQGTVRTMDISIKPVFNAGGQAPMLIIEGRDISERKQIEMALKESGKQQRLLSSQVLQAQEDERKRIARELHDGIGQYLSAIKYRVEHLILTHWDGERVPRNNSSLENVIPVIQGAIEEIRRICMDLRPSTLDDLGILATISWFCCEFQTTYSGILIKQKIQVEEQQIPVLLKTVIFRIIQEALNNIGKHSQADQIRLSLAQKDHNLHLGIRDNGVGFDLKTALSLDGSSRGLGLAGMKERATLSGGALTIHSQPGKGTRIQAAWPLGK